MVFAGTPESGNWEAKKWMKIENLCEPRLLCESGHFSLHFCGDVDKINKIKIPISFRMNRFGDFLESLTSPTKPIVLHYLSFYHLFW